jgi:hypothetical protein
MNVAAALVLQTVPFAGIVITREDGVWRDLFTVIYFAVFRLLVSMIAAVYDLRGISDLVGISAEAFQY